MLSSFSLGSGTCAFENVGAFPVAYVISLSVKTPPIAGLLISSCLLRATTYIQIFIRHI